jgi:uncharacterized Zn-finger protein
LGSVHFGTDEQIKAECEEALRDVNAELEVVRNGPRKGSQIPTAINPELFENDPLVKKLVAADPKLVDMLSRGPGYTNYGDADAFPCKICTNPPISYTRIHHLRRHMLKYHPEEADKEKTETDTGTGITLTCGRCGYQSKSPNELAAHMKTHGRQFHCSVCGVTISTQLRLEAHVRKVHGETGRFKCPDCGRCYAEKSYLNSHKRAAHAPEPKDPNDLICRDCGRKARSLKALRVHQQLHSATRKLSYCQICNEKLSCTFALRRHIRLVHLRAKEVERERAKVVIPPSELFL